MAHPFIDALPSAKPARLAAALTKAKSLQAKGSEAWTDDEVALALELPDVVKGLRVHEDARKALDDFMAAGGTTTTNLLDGTTDQHGGDTLPAVRKRASSGFAGALTKALAEQRPGMHSKALIPGGLVGFDFGAPIIESPKAPLTVAGLCALEPVTTPRGQRLQQTARNANAQAVPLLGQKPFTTATTVAAAWAVATIATLIGPVPKQHLADLPEALAWLGNEAAWAVAAALDSFILNGGQVEDGTTVTGLLNTTGVNTQALVSSDPLLTIRTAIGRLQATGVAPSGVLMNSDDWTRLSTIKDKSDRYILDAAPADAVVQRLWGLPVVLSNGLPANTAVVADFSTVNLLQREGYEAVLFESGQATPASGSGASRVEATDLAQTNAVMLRAEGRFGVFLDSLPSITKVALA